MGDGRAPGRFDFPYRPAGDLMGVSAMTLEFHARCDHPGCGAQRYVKATTAARALDRLRVTYGWQGDAERIVCKFHAEEAP